MKQTIIESLEVRQLFQAGPLPVDPTLSAADVAAILGHAASQAKSTQAIVVEDRNGNVLGEYDGAGLKAGPTLSKEAINEIRLDAALRARTAAFFESEGEAFTTRTARFIIQDHFPTTIQNTGGGPLYGVQFSSSAATDTIPFDTSIPNSPFNVPLPLNGELLINAINPAGLSGDPGGVPLYIMGIDSVTGKHVPIPVGSIGVAGDFSDTAARKDLLLPIEFEYANAANPNENFFQGVENPDFDEAVAAAGASGFMAPHAIQATQVFVAGLRLPFLATLPAHKNPRQTLAQLLSAAKGTTPVAPRDTTVGKSLGGGTPFTIHTVKGPEHGTLVRRNTREDPTLSTQNYGFIDSNDTSPTTGAPLDNSQKLTAQDVSNIISAAVARAVTTRAGIRNPIGSHVVVYISVVDRDGDLLGSFRMHDATNFSYDVSVQKARTAAFFSDNTHAFSDTAIGFMSQRYFATGINGALEGPVFDVQNGLAFANLANNGSIMDDTTRVVDKVAAPIADPTTATIPYTFVSGGLLSVGEIVTFGSDSSNEYLVTAINPSGFTVRPDNIDLSTQHPLPLTVGENIIPKNPLKDGFTIFPGGFPLYKNGQLVGAIGVSGDGVTQDDIIAYTGTGGLPGTGVSYRPPMSIESDALSADSITTFITQKVQTIQADFDLGFSFLAPVGVDYNTVDIEAEQRLRAGLSHMRLPYVKFPRNPFI